jgi:hypothetical protein
MESLRPKVAPSVEQSTDLGHMAERKANSRLHFAILEIVKGYRQRFENYIRTCDVLMSSVSLSIVIICGSMCAFGKSIRMYIPTNHSFPLDVVFELSDNLERFELFEDAMVQLPASPDKLNQQPSFGDRHLSSMPMWSSRTAS